MGVTYQTASEAVKARLGPAAAGHSVRVADVAASLAVRYGADPAKAKLAGLLHDWDREIPNERLLALAHDSSLEVASADVSAPHLLHARTAAARLPEALPGLSDDVLRAVAHHTVGSIDMSDLDMIIYIADMIEPGREYLGIPALRDAAASVTLRELFALCYQHTFGYLVSARRPIHPDTVAVWNALVAKDPR